MNQPMHRLINEWGQHDRKYCWLSTDTVDKNKREIYEGDRVKLFGDDENIQTVTFHDGAFWAGDGDLLFMLAVEDIEVIGHIAEEKNHVDC